MSCLGTKSNTRDTTLYVYNMSFFLVDSLLTGGKEQAVQGAYKKR